MPKVSVVIPNWNGADKLPACLDSLLAQSTKPDIIVVDNGSADGSLDLLKNYSEVKILPLSKNHGFAGGVNVGIEEAIAAGAEFVSLLNNDAVADSKWLEHLVHALKSNPELGIVASKILSLDGKYLDSTGDLYTIWGLPYPRGRKETDIDKYDDDRFVFGASGGASLYRISMLEEIGLFDEDFFAYYEDVDISFRAQLAGWKVAYESNAIVRHKIGATSVHIKGLTTYHTFKNLPFLLWKNVPWALMPKVWPRFVFAWTAMVFSALARGEFLPLSKAIVVGSVLWPKKMVQRHQIQKRRKVSVEYIEFILINDLPPNAHKLRKLRAVWWKIRGKS